MSLIEGRASDRSGAAPTLRAILAVLLLACLLAFPPAAARAQGPRPEPTLAPVPTSEPDAAPTPQPGSEQAEYEKLGWGEKAVRNALLFLIKVITAPFAALVLIGWNRHHNFVTYTPEQWTYNLGVVLSLWGQVRTLASTAVVGLALWGFLKIAAGEQLGMRYHDAMELLPRLALALLGANVSIYWVKLLIDLNNALCLAVAGDLAGGGKAPFLRSVDEEGMDAAFLYMVLVVALALLVLGMLMRLALIDFLIVVSPLAVVLWALSDTDRWSRLWSQLLTGAIFGQFLQAVALKLALMLVAEWERLLPMGEAPTGDQRSVSLLLNLAALALVYKIPGLIGDRLESGSGLGIFQYVTYRQVAKGLERGLSRRGAP